jgi:hypothetical protein
MYGLVNRGIEEMVRAAGGSAMWEAVRVRAVVDDAVFLSAQDYPDDVTYRLVGAAAEVLDLPPAEVLRRFGHHWITYTGKEGYGPLLTLGGATLPEFLGNLDALHSRLALSMPELKPPSFVVTPVAEQQLRVEYYSTRTGLAPLVIGLLEGLGDMFGTPASVTQTASREAGGRCDEFLVAYCDS